MSLRKGVFHVIATPIGNLSDITLRAKEAMSEVDILYAEDTRHTSRLCAHLGIKPKLRSLHDHNEEGRIAEVTEHLRSGLSVGLVSDAGTPLISDPGYRIVAACLEAGLPVSPVPGVSALTAALSVCGLPTDSFLFKGFLSSKSGARQKALSELKAERATLVFYESKHRIVDSLADIQATLGDRKVCVARELTKAFETVLQGPLSEIRQLIIDNVDWQKGEFVVVVSGAVEVAGELTAEVQNLLLELSNDLAPRRAAHIVANHSGVPKKVLYNWLLEQKDGTGGA